MVDKRGRLLISLKPSHRKLLVAICEVTDSDETEVFLDALKFYHRDLIRSGAITLERDAGVRLIKTIASIMGNDDGEIDDIVDDINAVSC